MLRTRTGAAASASSGAATALYLTQESLRPENAALAQYYGAEVGAVANVQPGLDPQLARLLAIDASRPLDTQELAHLLTGLRADGEGILRKQVQRPTRSISAVFGLDDKSLPSSDAVEHVLAGRRADGNRPVDADGAALPDKTVDGARKRFLGVYGVHGREPTDEQVERIKSGRMASGVEASPADVQWKLHATKLPTAYLEMVWSADKSVSVAWALAPTEAERALIQHAHNAAVQSAMAYVTDTALGFTRRGDSGRVEPGSTAAINITHFAARPTAEIARVDDQGQSYTQFEAVPVRTADPALHSHSILLNVVRTADGHVGSVDFDRLNGRIHEFGAVYQAEVAQNLRAIGIATHMDRETGAARVSAVSDGLRQQYCKRSENVQDAARQFAKEAGHDWDALSGDQQSALLRRGVQETRLAKEHRNDGTSDFAAWRKQAEAAGYQHRSVVRPERQPELTPAERHRVAYDASLPIIERELAGKAKLDISDFRVAAARGLVESGISDRPQDDIDAVMQMYSRHGVRQDGALTRVLIGQDVPVRGKARQSVTTERHLADETRVLELARALGTDRTGAIPQERLDETKAAFLATRPHIDPDGRSWREQSAAIDAVGNGPRLAVVEGIAGSGKTTLLTPLVAAAHAEERAVYGLSRGWKQATALRDAGISQQNINATSTFLNRVEKGKLRPNRDSIVIIDELSQVGRGEMLRLLELQQTHGFRVVAVGDPRQGGSIDPESIKLLTAALGDQVPQILTSVRQRTEREREIAGLFREGGQATSEAISMKRHDGTAIAVAGGRPELIAETARLWRERVEARGSEPDFKLTMSAPTNRDAHEISVAVRKEARNMGLIGQDAAEITVMMRGETELQRLALAPNDRIRLFNRVVVNREHFASNGDTVTVLSANNDAMRVRRDDGQEAVVKFDQLRVRRNEPVQIAYGYAVTIDAAQGTTSSEHINALPDGSRAVGARKAYPAESRHRDTTWLVTNEAAERREIVARLPRGTFQPIQPDDIWRNVSANLGRGDVRETATDFVRNGSNVKRGSLMALPAASVQSDMREKEGRPAPVFQQTQDLHQAQRVSLLHQTMERVQQAVHRVRDVARERLRAIAWHKYTQTPEYHAQREAQRVQAQREAQRVAQRPTRGMTMER